MVLYTCAQKDKGASLPGPIAHPCGLAMKALADAGHPYEHRIVAGYKFLPWTRRGGVREEVKRASGQEDVPVLVLDGGEAISGSGRIVAWARDNPAA